METVLEIMFVLTQCVNHLLALLLEIVHLEPIALVVDVQVIFVANDTYYFLKFRCSA